MYTLKSWYLEASEDIITKFKSQGLYTIKIKYWNASGSGFPPSLIPALQNIGILHHKKAKLPKHLQHSVYVMIVGYKIGIRDLNPQDPHDSLQWKYINCDSLWQ